MPLQESPQLKVDPNRSRTRVHRILRQTPYQLGQVEIFFSAFGSGSPLLLVAVDKAVASTAAEERLRAAMPWPWQMVDPERLRSAIEEAKALGVAATTVVAAKTKLWEAEMAAGARVASGKVAAETAAAAKGGCGGEGGGNCGGGEGGGG